MSGFQEILLIAVILLAIFFIPRMTAKQSGGLPMRSVQRRLPGIPKGKLRLALVVSLLWLSGCLVLWEPWHGSGLRSFLIWGVGPVVLFWSARWVWEGFRKRR